MNPYYDPEQFGLRMVGQVDWSDGDYQFNYTTVWQRLADGAFMYGEDSGCSCPAPYEQITSVDELTTATIDEIKTQLDKRNAEPYNDGPRDAEIAVVLEAMLEARRTWTPGTKS